MTAQMLFFYVFSKKDPHFNAVEDISKFIMLLWKGVYLYEYMDNSEKFNGTLLSKKEDFYSHLNMEDIIAADYTYTKGICKDFRIKHFGKNHNLYFQTGALLLAAAFKKFRNMCLAI